MTSWQRLFVRRSHWPFWRRWAKGRGRVGAAPAGPRSAPPDWRAVLRRRVAVVAGGVGLWVAAIELRLAYLQIVKRAELLARADSQQNRIRELPAKRGDIVDRSGHLLATSVDVDTVYAVPSDIADAGTAAADLCRALGDCTDKERQALAARLARRGAFTYVRRQISPEQRRRVEALGLEGVGFMKESRRFYPNKELAAHVLGYVGLDNAGLGGLEAAYDSKIRGQSGRVLVQTDAKRHAFSRFEKPPTSGATIELTIDAYLQHVAERELAAGVAENRAAGGTAIILNPHTGEILAMASVPTFNPNSYRDADESARRNRAVQDLYEPGSTFKVVTASAAIEEKVLPIDALIDTNPGQITLPGRPPITEDGRRNYGVLSLTDVIVKSSNIGAIRIGFKVGTERLSRFVAAYGFGRPVSPDFPGENPGIVWSPAKWTDSALASVSMGYQVGVTPLQMVAAVASVANGGLYLEPRVVRAVYQNNRRYAVEPKVVRRTIGPDTAAALTAIMEQVVARGTARRAQIPGYTIAGKTGTAAKLVGGRYSHSDYNASFVGFLPSRDPVLAMIVVVDSPHGPNGTHGGSVAAPIFKRIGESALRYLGVPRTLEPDPPVLVAHREPAAPVPAAAPAAADAAPDSPPGTVPDLEGLSAREAVRRLARAGIGARLTGDGFVVSQMPPAGSPIDDVGVCTLVLARLPGRARSGALAP